MEKVEQSDPVTISISVVSHGQMHLIEHLMQDLRDHCIGQDIEFILTLNIDEDATFAVSAFWFPIRIIRNADPKGFGANHNQAFQMARGHYFCVLNPDIRFVSCPFSGLISSFKGREVGVTAPFVLSPSGQVEDSARRFPTPQKIFAKLLSKSQSPDYVFESESCTVDWVGGMFMLFPRSVFQRLNGFDDRYFLYYEDVDICARLSLSNLQVQVCSQTGVVHHAQRSSHRHLKYLVWHLSSMLRFFTSPVYRQLWRLGRL